MGPADQPPRAPTAPRATPEQSRRFVALLTALVLAIAFAGFIVGVGRGPGSARATSRALQSPEFPRELIAKAHGIVPALRYNELPTTRRGPNATWRAELASMASGVSPTEAATDAAVLAAVAARAERRAFDGAPPTVPHPIEQRSTSACLACHQSGLLAGKVRAPAMSHPVMGNCTQCHVETRNGVVDSPPAGRVESAFVGLQAATAGARAFAGAPPTMPHASWMRERCGSCHGPSGQPALRTSHFERASCTQCHASSAALDQRDEVQGGPPPTAVGGHWPLPAATRREPGMVR